MKFSSDISLLWLLPVAVIAFFAAKWMYSTKANGWVNELSNKWRNIFITLRTLSFFLLALLLFGILFQAFQYRKEKPILVLGIDTSSSMLNYKDSATIEKDLSVFIQQVQNDLGEKFDVQLKSFSNGVSEWNKLKFNHQVTDLHQALEGTRADFYNRNLAAVLMVSDGNYNQGTNPLYAADAFSTSSIYTIGTGDTILKRDQLIKHIQHNDIAFLKNDFPVVVDLSGIKMGKISTEVSIEQGGKKIASQQVNFKDGVNDYEQVMFNLQANSPGIQQYTVTLSAKENEYNYTNNKRTFYVEVIDSRSKILLLSQAPHPDVSALKSVWEKDQNLDVQFHLLADWNRDLKNVDLIVWHEPGITADKSISDLIINNSISKLFIIGTQSQSSNLTNLQLGIDAPNSRNIDDIEGSINTNFNAFEFSEQLQKAINYYPPLKAKFGTYKTPNDANTFIYQRIGPVIKKDPLLYFSTSRSNASKPFKLGVFIGEGIWKWKMTEYARTQSTVAFDELVAKMGQFLMVKQNTEPFRVTLPKKYTPLEDILISATVLNASLEPIITAQVQFELKNESNRVTKLQFGASGTSYQLNLGKLDAGKYTWKAYTSINEKYHEKKGEFVVEPVYLEQADNHANHTLLRQLADKTDGAFATLKNGKKIIEQLKKREDFTSMSYQESNFKELIDYFILFILLFVTLSAEWFLRRYLGSY